MARIRLNQSKRDNLLTLAAVKLKDAALPDEISKKLDDARKVLLKVYPLYVKTLKATMRQVYPLAKLKIHNEAGNLEKLYALTIQHGADFCEMRFPSPSRYRHHNEDSSAVAYLAAKYGCLSDQIERVMQGIGENYHTVMHNLVDKNWWFQIDRNGTPIDFKTMEHIPSHEHRAGEPNRFLDKTGDVYRVCMQMKDAMEAFGAAERAAEQHTAQLRQSYVALISGARNLEDVAAVWPEANELRDQFIADNQLPALLSDEALNLIRADVAQRNSD